MTARRDRRRRRRTPTTPAWLRPVAARYGFTPAVVLTLCRDGEPELPGAAGSVVVSLPLRRGGLSGFLADPQIGEILAAGATLAVLVEDAADGVALDRFVNARAPAPGSRH